MQEEQKPRNSSRPKFQIYTTQSLIDKVAEHAKPQKPNEYAEEVIEASLTQIKIIGYVRADSKMEVHEFHPPVYRNVGESFGKEYYGLIVVGNSLKGNELILRDGETLIFRMNHELFEKDITHVRWMSGLQIKGAIREWSNLGDNGIALRAALGNDGDEILIPKSRMSDVLPVGVFVTKK